MTTATRRKSRRHLPQTAEERRLDRARCKEYGTRVRMHREDRGMTQAALGELIGKSVSQVSNIENGVNWSDMPVYRRLCELFKLGVPPLMG
jgi:ribosome-binding protein aMBF1 (putative translation factor)